MLRQHQQKQNDLDKLFVFCYFLLFLVLLLLMVVLVLRQAAKDHAKGDLAKASHAALVDKQRIILARLSSARLSFCVWRYWRPMTEKEPWRPPRRTRKARCRSGIFLMWAYGSVMLRRMARQWIAIWRRKCNKTSQWKPLKVGPGGYHSSIFVYVYVYIYVYIYNCVYICIYVLIYIYICIFRYVCIYHIDRFIRFCTSTVSWSCLEYCLMIIIASLCLQEHLKRFDVRCDVEVI